MIIDMTKRDIGRHGGDMAQAIDIPTYYIVYVSYVSFEQNLSIYIYIERTHTGKLFMFTL